MPIELEALELNKTTPFAAAQRLLELYKPIIE